MKTKYLVMVLAATAAVAAYYVVAVTPNLRHQAEWRRTVEALRHLSLGPVQNALEAFTRDQKASGKPLPQTVPLENLVSSGYLRAEEVAGLSGSRTTVTVGADETKPQLILIRVELPDEREIVLLLDGSIQQLAQ